MKVLDADKFIPVLDAAYLFASKVIQASAIIVIKQKERTAYMQPNLMQVLNSHEMSLRIGCSIIPCIQSVSSACNIFLIN